MIEITINYFIVAEKSKPKKVGQSIVTELLLKEHEFSEEIFPVSVWNKEEQIKNLNPGDRVGIKGLLLSRTYTVPNTGEKKFYLSIKAKEIYDEKNLW